MTKRPRPDARTFARSVVEKLRSAGHEALWAGGSVRDLVLGHTPKDFDVATSARPEEVMKLFPRTVAVGASFGVINVVGGKGLTVEVATFRSDGKYLDGRRPTSVEYTTSVEDAKRRDFTINGMFFDPIREEVLDYVGGRDDIERRLLRAIGDPTARFEEDKLRMLRAVRFAARLGFVIEEETLAAILIRRGEIVRISPERILAELRAILEHLTRVRGVELLEETGLFPFVLPEFVSPLAAHAGQTLAILGYWSRPVSFPLALAGLGHGFDERQGPRVADETLVRLRASNEERDRTGWLLSQRATLMDASSKPVHLLKRILAEPGQEELLDFAQATEWAVTGGCQRTDALRARLLTWGERLNPPPLVTGDDLVALGHRPGKLFKEILDSIRNSQLDDEISTRVEAIARIQRNWPT